MNLLLLLLVIATLLPALACGSPETQNQPPVVPAPVAEGPTPDAVAEARASVQEPSPEDPHPALDNLLRLPPAEELAPEGPQSVDWAGQREEEKREADRKKARAKIDFSQENVTEGLPMQEERRRTDVGVSVPVGANDRLRVRGGIRVDERETSDEEREAETVPTVGVEVRF